MADLKIRFIAQAGPISKSIQFFSHSPWSHVELITDRGTYIGAHYNGGIQERPPDYCNPVRERHYAIPVSDSDYIRAANFAHAKIGIPYNYKDIIGMVIHKKLDSPDRYICSQFIMEWAEAGGIQLLNVKPNFNYLITPGMIHLSPVLIGRCIYSKG